VIFGRELPLRRASVKKKMAAHAAIFFDNRASRDFNQLIKE